MGPTLGSKLMQMYDHFWYNLPYNLSHLFWVGNIMTPGRQFAPEHRPNYPKRKGSSPKQHFSGVLLVSGSV